MDLAKIIAHERSDQNFTPFTSLGIVELLEADTRATFALRIDPEWRFARKLQPVLVNASLRDHNVLVNHLFNVNYSSSTELCTFASWIHEPSHPRGSIHEYANVEWHLTVVADSWLVIGATHVVDSARIAESVHSTAPIIQPPAESFDWTQSIIPVQCSEYVHQLRSRDWASTAVGPMSTWSDELRLLFNSMMRTETPQAMYWGRDMIVIYNQAFIPIVGEKHPRILGQKASVAWSEDWQSYGRIFEMVLNSAVPIETQQCMMLHRSGFVEEAHFDYSILPIIGSGGYIRGLHTTVHEITETILAERRLKTTTNVREYTAGCSTIDEIYQHFLSALDTSKEDVAFAIIYSQPTDGVDTVSMDSVEGIPPGVQLKGFVGLSPDSLPSVITTTSTPEPFRHLFDKASKLQHHIVLPKHDETLSGIRDDSVLPEYGHSAGFEQAVLYPLRAPSADGALGFLLIGLNSRRPYDRAYQQFTATLYAQLSEALDSSIIHLRELRKQQEQADLEKIRLQQALAKQARETKAMEQRFTRLTEMSPVAINIARLDGTIEYANNTWHKYFGEGPESYQPMSWLGKMYEEDVEKASCLWAALATEGKVIDYEFRIKKPWVSSVSNDELLPYTSCLGSAYAQTTEDGQVEVIGTAVDITHQKWIAQESQKRTAEVINAKKQQDAFTDMVAHEMRNPLNAIVQCADIIQSSLSDASDGVLQYDSTHDIIENARIIMHCAMHQKHIIDDLLTLSKLDSDLLSFVPVRSNPVRIMTQVMEMFEAEAKASDITFTSHVDSSIANLRANEAMLDPQRVSQVLVNLITNAIKFTRDRPQRFIKVSVAADTGRSSFKSSPGFKYFPSNRKRPSTEPHDDDLFFMFSVTDTGPGIPAAAESRLFQRFSQTSLKSHVVYGGSGLGLWISRELTEMQGGEIGFQSYPEGGTTFAFYVRTSYLPPTHPKLLHRQSITGREGLEQSVAELSIVEQPPDKLIPPSVQDVKRDINLKTINVLLTEDNLINQKLMKRQLEKIFKKVSIANNGQEALDLMAKTNFGNGEAETSPKIEDIDVIFMDIEMPVLNGVDSTKAIRKLEAQGQLDKRIPIIAVSANARPEQIAQYREAGMDDALSKPFVMRDLVALVSRIL